MKQIIKALTMTIALIPSVGLCGAPVHDPMSYAELVKVLQETKKHIDETKRVHGELVQAKAIMGSFKEDKQSLTNSLLNWQTYYDKIDDLDPEYFSAFKWLGVDKLHPENYASDTFGYASSFSSKKALDDVKRQMFEDDKNPAQMQYRRQELVRNSMATSVVVSNESKANIAGAKKKLNDATTKAVTASSSADAMKSHNELLSIAVAELIQLRELQAQQLELLSSFFVGFHGTGKLENPAKKPNVKKPWE
jgi:hypothetical protein